MKKIENMNKDIWTSNLVVLFTDIKDFTAKTSLLTRKQIDDLLKKQDDIVLPVLEEYSWELVKTIGDGYMVIFSSPTNAILAAIDIQKQISVYNADKKNSIERLEFRIAINVGELNKKVSNRWVDYFWEPVNIASRLLDKTPENYIYITQALYFTMNKNEIQSLKIGEMSFKGIPDKITVYNVLFDERLIKEYKEGRLKEVNKSKDYSKKNVEEEESMDYEKIKEVDKVVFNYSAMSAVIAFQPLPFADYFIFTPIHIYMIIRIGELYGMKLNVDIAKAILFQILGILWYDYVSKQVVIGLYKIWLPFLAGYIVLPLTFSLTYWVGKVVNIYFFYKSRNIDVSKEHLKEIFNDKRMSWLSIAQNNKDIIKKVGSKFKKNVYKYMKFLNKEKGWSDSSVYKNVKDFEWKNSWNLLNNIFKFVTKNRFKFKDQDEWEKEENWKNI